MSAKGLLAELESLGAFGEQPAPAKPKVAVVTARPPVDKNVLERAQVLCDRATTLMEASIQAQFQLVEVLAQIRALGSPSAEEAGKPAEAALASESSDALSVDDDSAPESGESPSVVDGAAQ